MIVMDEACAEMPSARKVPATPRATKNILLHQAAAAEQRCREINARVRREISAAMTARGMSYSKLASLCGLSISSVSRILSPQTRANPINAPKFGHVVVMYEVLGLSLPFTEKKYSEADLVSILARVMAYPSFMPSNTDLQAAEHQVNSLIASANTR